MADEKAKSFLVDWTTNFLKNKDIILRKIEQIEHNKDGFDIKVTYKDKTQFFVVTMKLIDINHIMERFKDPEGHYAIVTFNMKENIDAMAKHWNHLVKFKYLSVYFINPWSNADKKWIIYPHTHNKICEEDSLHEGLHSMAELVEFLTEEHILNNVKNL